MNVFTLHPTPPDPFTQVTWTLLHPTPPHPFPPSGNPRPQGHIYIYMRQCWTWTLKPTDQQSDHPMDDHWKVPNPQFKTVGNIPFFIGFQPSKVMQDFATIHSMGYPHLDWIPWNPCCLVHYIPFLSRLSKPHRSHTFLRFACAG